MLGTTRKLVAPKLFNANSEAQATMIPSIGIPVTRADLDCLIADQTAESSHLDFKRDLPTGWSDKVKNDLIADVTAFANSGGGCLIFGIDEQEGCARNFVPQQVDDLDFLVRRIQDVLLHGVEPRLPPIDVSAVAIAEGDRRGHAIILRIPESWNGPHRSKMSQHFYIRDGARNRPLDVPELRTRFLKSEDQGNRLRAFRVDRIAKILSGDAPCALESGSVLVLHLIPLDAANGNISVDPARYNGYSGTRVVPSLMSASFDIRINIDGVLRSTPGTEGAHDYSLLFRSGFLEAAEIYNEKTSPSDTSIWFPSGYFERSCITLVERFRSELEYLAANTTLIAMLSLLRASELVFGSDARPWAILGSAGNFDRPTILLPDIVLSSDATAPKALRPMIDLVWQAAGFDRSPNFDSEGEWIPRKR